MANISNPVSVGFALLSLAVTQTRLAGVYLAMAAQYPNSAWDALDDWRRLKADARKTLEWSRQHAKPRLP